MAAVILTHPRNRILLP